MLKLLRKIPVAKASRSRPQIKFDTLRCYSFTAPIISYFKLPQLKKAALTNGDERSLIAYLNALGKTGNAHEAIGILEKGWTDKSIPITEELLREYLRAIGTVNGFDNMNIVGLLQIINQANGGPDGKNKRELFQTSANYGINPSFISSGIRAGANPNEPIYVSQAPPPLSMQVFRVLRYIAGMFLVLSFASAMLDDSKGGGGLASRMGMGSATHQAEHSDKSFNDVVGIDEAKSELQEIVHYLKDPKRFTRLGGKLPKGVLLTGPPGTGKTLLARAIAGEAGVPFFFASGSEFEEMFVGVGARRVRDLFEAAKQKSPCIIFIDEIDAIGGSRHLKEQSSMKMTLNQLLVEMDGFEQNTGVIVIAATNFPETLDSALIRPGRFDKHVDVPMPDIGGRKAILELYAKKVPMSRDVDLSQIARGTPGFSGAELFNLINQAALKASVDGMRGVTMAALEYAKDKIMMGSERRSAIISPETMRLTAYHEAGHALVALKSDGADPVHKATIMPRGRALGMVMQLPDGDQTSYSRKQMLARLDVCMGGRVAEELVFGAENVTSGASSDIQQATKLAKAMVTKYGLSNKIGIMFVDDKEKVSSATQGDVDDEVRQILQDSYNRAKAILQTNRRDLEMIAQGLLEYEALSGGEIMDILKGVKIDAKIRSQKPSRDLQAILEKKKDSTTSRPTKEDGRDKGDGSGGEGGGGSGPSGGNKTVKLPTKKVLGPPTVVSESHTSTAAVATVGVSGDTTLSPPFSTSKNITTMPTSGVSTPSSNTSTTSSTAATAASSVSLWYPSITNKLKLSQATSSDTAIEKSNSSELSSNTTSTSTSTDKGNGTSSTSGSA